MRLLIVFLAVVAPGLAQNGKPPAPPQGPSPPGTDGMEEQPQKSPCCFPDQWKGKVALYSTFRDDKGNFGDSYSIRKFAFDFPANKLMGNEVQYNKDQEPITNITFYGDLGRKKMHLMKHFKQQCGQFDFPHSIQGQCISEEAEFMGNSTVGVGDTAIAVDHYKIIIKKGEMDLYMKIGVTSEGCVPIYSMTGGSLGDGNKFSISSKFYNNEVVINDTAIFEAPEKCKDAHPIEIPQVVKGNMYLNQQFYPSNSPNKCCFPKAWEGKMQQYSQETVNGQTTRSYVYMPVAVDYGQRKFSVEAYIKVDGTWYRNVTFIGDLGYGVLYAKDRETKECKKYNIPATEKMSWECISPEAKYYGKKTLGPKNNGLETSVWKIHLEEENNASWNLTLKVAQQDGVCVPVGEMLFGTKPDSQRMINIAFSDMCTKVEDDVIFQPPEGCSEAVAEPWKDMPPVLYDVVEDFVEGFF